MWREKNKDRRRVHSRLTILSWTADSHASRNPRHVCLLWNTKGVAHHCLPEEKRKRSTFDNSAHDFTELMQEAACPLRYVEVRMVELLRCWWKDDSSFLTQTSIFKYFISLVWCYCSGMCWKSLIKTNDGLLTPSVQSLNSFVCTPWFLPSEAVGLDYVKSEVDFVTWMQKQ